MDIKATFASTARIVSLASAVPIHEIAYRRMLKSQWWPREQLGAEQARKLRALVRHAWEKVPYYRRVFRERGVEPGRIRTAADLPLLPVLEKSAINANLDEMVARGFPARRLLLYSTGGSTGLPTRFYHDAVEMAWTEAAVNRSYTWSGYRRGERFLLVAGIPGEKTSLVGRIRRLQGQRKISLFGAGDQEISEVMDYILSLGPVGIKGYVSWLRVVAEELVKRGARWRPAHVITAAEKLNPDDREFLRRGFGVEPFENYSSREFMLAAECEEHRGLHIAAENVIIETVRDGKPVGPGELGEILVTDLNRYGMPMIRYAIGDAGILSDRACPCGRGLPLLEEVSGRITEIVRTPQGRIMGVIVAHIFKDLPLKMYRVIQETPEEVIVRMVKAPGFGPEHEEHVRKSFGPIPIRIEYVDHIPVPPSGKRIVVESRLKNI